MNDNDKSTILSHKNGDISCNCIVQNQYVGSVYMVSIPSGAKIFIDNVEQVGITTPAIVNNIPSTPHTYKLSKSGYTDFEGLLFITTGQTYNTTITMSGNNPWPLILGIAFVGLLIMTK